MTLVLGHACDPATLAPTGAPTRLDPATLTRHAVCVGMTGSGKTGLCVSLLESVAGAGVPVLALDPKGDLANLALQFPGLDPAALLPWVDPVLARREGLTAEALAARTAARWREGLARDGVDAAAHQRFVDGVDVQVLTPGSEAGIGVDVLAALTRCPEGLADDPEGLREYVTGAVTALLGLVGERADPMIDPASILLARLLEDAFTAGEALPLEALLARVVDPPFADLGHFPVDRFLPREARTALAVKLNALAASSAFAPWRRGVPLDVGALLAPRDGRTAVRVLYLAHLSDAQRMFFVTLLLHGVVAWSRRQAGTGALRALVYFDEVFGFLPPHPKDPPSKEPALRLMKQARAVGLGVVLATQNPVDVDYKALSNAGTWLVGRLQTPQDRERVTHGLGAAGVDVGALGDVLGRLPGRTFLWRGPDGGGVVRSRHCLSLLRGPLTRREVARLADPAARAAWRGGISGRAPAAPVGVHVRWLSPEVPDAVRARLGVPERAADGEPAWRAGVLVRCGVRFQAGGWSEERIVDRWVWPADGAAAPGPEGLADVAFEAGWLLREPPGGEGYGPLPPWLGDADDVRRWAAAVREVVAAGSWAEGPGGVGVRAAWGDVRVGWIGVVWVG